MYTAAVPLLSCVYKAVDCKIASILRALAPNWLFYIKPMYYMKCQNVLNNSDNNYQNYCSLATMLQELFLVK